LDGEGFYEVETPLLWKSTPEGAREYTVPVRTHPGLAFVLPQSPQICKQLLMVGGIEKYFQIARCSATKAPAVTVSRSSRKIDLEMSFVVQEDVLQLWERLFAHLMRECMNVEVPTPFPRLTYAECIERFGSDKPDTRFGMELKGHRRHRAAKPVQGVSGRAGKRRSGQGDLRAGLRRLHAQAVGRIDRTRQAIRGQRLGHLRHRRELCKTCARPSPSSFRASNSPTCSPASKPSPATWCCASPTGPAWSRNRSTFCGAKWRSVSTSSLRALRLFCGWWTPRCLNTTRKRASFDAMHHPFCLPNPDDMPLLEEGFSSPLSKGDAMHPWARVRSWLYDLVLNGSELSSGSIRCHRRDIQQKIFDVIGVPPETAQERFGFMLDAFEYGAPPHGGIAAGFDRVVAILANVPGGNIREVIAFPKTTGGSDPLTGAPTPIPDERWQELGLMALPREAE
jgi:aspartyl-tRNA synthetase